MYAMISSLCLCRSSIPLRHSEICQIIFQIMTQMCFVCERPKPDMNHNIPYIQESTTPSVISQVGDFGVCLLLFKSLYMVYIHLTSSRSLILRKSNIIIALEEESLCIALRTMCTFRRELLRYVLQSRANGAWSHVCDTYIV